MFVFLFVIRKSRRRRLFASLSCALKAARDIENNHSSTAVFVFRGGSGVNSLAKFSMH